VGVIAVHVPSGIDTGEQVAHWAVQRQIDRFGIEGGRWVVLHTRIPPIDTWGYAPPIGEDDTPPPYAWLQAPEWYRWQHPRGTQT
jgi:hypothetical protein